VTRVRDRCCANGVHAQLLAKLTPELVLVHTGNVTIVRVAGAFDHRGVRLRKRVLEAIQTLGHELVDLGVDTDAERVDYPDKALEVGDAIRSGAADRAVFVCGSGVGASVAASKLAGIRAAVCHDPYSARQGVEHDDMNVLCLGSDVIGPELASELVRAFVRAEFNGGERYVRRLRKVEEMETTVKEGARGGTTGSPTERAHG
jgi:ribose 5-phosphate isomerase B